MPEGQGRVAPSDRNNTRAYFSLCRNCDQSIMDCQGSDTRARKRLFDRLRQQAINILSIRLRTAPAGCLDAWLEVLTLLENI